MGDYTLRSAHIRDIRPLVLDGDGRLRILPAAFWSDVSTNERVLLGHHTGIYVFPTLELVERLREIIGDRTAIEIGSGNGVLAEALGIPATDSKVQDEPKYKEIYQREYGTPQATAPYGPNVEKLDAAKAVRKYKPQVVLGCWVTHRFDKNMPWLSGFEAGVDEADVLDHCEEYVFVGNKNPTTKHTSKPIWKSVREIEMAPYVYSRSKEHGKDFIARWTGRAGR